MEETLREAAERGLLLCNFYQPTVEGRRIWRANFFRGDKGFPFGESTDDPAAALALALANAIEADDDDDAMALV